MDGTTISHYRIVNKLGAGGMGEVYLAEDLKLGRKVAIKILSEEFTTNRDRLHRFEQEASAASALNHPNILTIHEVGVDDGRHFIATEYIDGITLRRKIAASKLEVVEILDIAVQVASALEEAHAAGIVHRDIKPDNVMVRRNGFVKVLDFGLAKLTESSIDRTPADAEAATRVLVQTDAGVVMGTSHYMSPEQARGKVVDPRSDIWSLGVLIYEMVAGRKPFEGETSTDVIVAITQKEPPPLARFAQNVPAELDWIVTKALRKDRDERYQTIKELLVDLKRLKQRLEFEVELERSTAPDSLTRSAITPAPGSPTVPEKALETVEKSGTHLSSAEYLVTEIKRHKWAASLIALLLVGGLALVAYLYTRKEKPLTDKDTVLIADFVNTTGEPVFDGTLKQALSVQLGQTPFLNIFPDDRVRETLKFMGRSQDERITKSIGREICERAGIKALLLGSIASLGSHYVITLEAVNGQNGASIATEQIEADSKEKVLSSLGTAASNLREKLGESLSSITKYNVGIEQATTSSLEALKAYAQGNEERARGKGRESLELYEKAVQLDPNFAMAYARIGVYYGNRSQLELAKEYVQKAYDLRDRVSEHEKLYITEKYYGYIVGNLDKVIETLQTWSAQYPQDYIPHNNLALNYLFIGRFADAQKEAMEALKLSPNNLSAHENLIASFLGLERFDEAEQALKGIAAINPKSSSLLFNGFLFAFIRGDHATMEKIFEPLKGTPEEADALFNMSQVDAYFGKLDSARQRYEIGLQKVKDQNRMENASLAAINAGNSLAMVGKCADAKKQLGIGLSFSRGRLALWNAALLAAQCNDVAQAEVLVEEMSKKYPEDTALSGMGVPSVKALLALNRGQAAEALQILEPLRRFDMGFMLGVTGVYLRGQAYLQQKMTNEAAAEFQRVIDRRGIEIYSKMHVLAHLWLARTAVVAGDTAKARKSYQDFFAIWKDADADLPVLIQAKKEYEQLK